MLLKQNLKIHRSLDIIFSVFIIQFVDKIQLAFLYIYKNENFFFSYRKTFR